MASKAAEERREREGPVFREEMPVWLSKKQFQPPSIVEECLKLLNEEYLLSRPLPRGVVLPATLGPRNYRFLFRRNVASLLRWTERPAEGHAQGFSDSINQFIRKTWWPDEASEALYIGPVAQGLAPDLCSDAEASVLLTPSRVKSATTGSGTSIAAANRANKGIRVQQAGSKSTLLNRDQSLDEMVDEGDRVRGAEHEEGMQRRSSSTVIFDQQDGISTSSHALDQRLVVPAGTGRSIRQRLEVGNSGEIVMEQPVTVLPVMEDTTTLQPGTSKRKRMGNGKTPNPSGCAWICSWRL